MHSNDANGGMESGSAPLYIGAGDKFINEFHYILDDVKDGRAVAGSVYVPSWYGVGAAGDVGASGSGGGGGLFSSSAVPNLGGMMSALGTIGNSPSSSSSGGGGFSGGSSGGGGGGSGGGF